MAEDVVLKSETSNSCCTAWKDKYIKLEEKRNALRQAVKLLEQQINKVQVENLNLKKGYEEERARASIDREGKEKESAVRASLEKELLDLKSQISSFEQNNVDALNVHEKLKQLNALIAGDKKEIKKLKELLETEKKKADAERKNAEMRKEEAAQASKAVKAERSKASDLRKSHKIEVEKANECRQQIKVLKEESEEVKLKLASETSKLIEASKELEVERQKTIKEKKRANIEMTKSEALRLQAEASRKEAREEKSRAKKLLQQLERKDCKIEELQKQVKGLLTLRSLGETLESQLDKKTDNKAAKKNGKPGWAVIERDASELELVPELVKAREVNMRHVDMEIMKETLVDFDMMKSEKMKKQIEIYCRKAIEEKCRADQLSFELEENKRKVEDLQRKLHEFKSSRKVVGPSVVSFEHARSSERTKMELLKKKLKFEKMRLKHARQVADFEKGHRSIIRQEVDRVKLEFIQLSNHVDALHKFASTGPKDTNDLGKPRNADDLPNSYLKKNLHATEPLQTWMPDTLKQTPRHIPSLLPLSGGNYMSSVSGIETRLESLPGDSNRKMLQSCAIDSSTASFSDGQLMASQGKAGLAMMTSAKSAEENLKGKSKRSNLSGEFCKMKSNEKLALVAENSVKTPIKSQIGRVNEKSQKRKMIFETVESIECLYNESKKMHLQVEEKLSVLHALNSHNEKPLKNSSNIVEDSLADHRKFQKKRKTSCQKKKQHLLDDNEMKLNKIDGEVCCRSASVGRHPSQHVSNLTDHFQPCLEELNYSGVIQTLETFGNIAADGNYMSLLNLDSAADEECYRRAMERPLSPTLPDINVSGVETCALVDLEPLVDEFHKGLLNENEYELHSHSYDVIDAEIKSNCIQCGSSGFSGDMLSYENKGQFDPSLSRGSHTSDIVQADENCVHQVGDFVVGVPVTNGPTSGLEGAELLLEIKSGIEDNCIPYSCVLFSNSKDCYSISRIFSATRACIGRFSLKGQKEWMVQDILAALKMEHELLPEEKTCVFFSLLLLNFTVVALHKYGHFFWNGKTCLDSFLRHMSEAMLDVETRSLFSKLLSLDELLILAEDFIIDGRVLSLTAATSETLIQGDARVNIVLDGISGTFSLAPASVYYLVAGSTVLASISKAVGCTGFLCGVSYNILRLCRYESSLMLIMLHVFAHIGGDQFFSSEGHSVMMAVLKSIVMHLEGVRLSDDSTLNPPEINSRTEFIQCANCPFSEKVVTMPIVVSFLFELIQQNISNVIMDEDIVKSSNSLNLRAFFGRHKANQFSSKNSSCEELHRALCMNWDDFCCLNNNKASDDQLGSVLNAAECDVGDAISLVELLACFMRWNWTCVNIIPQLLKILESSVKHGFTPAIVILLGQLGRFGVDAGGFEDEGVRILRSNLSEFLCLDTTIKSGLAVQIATVSSLLGLFPFDFEAITQDKVSYSAVSSQYVQVNLIKKWFSLLSPKQKELSFNILRSAACNGS